MFWCEKNPYLKDDSQGVLVGKKLKLNGFQVEFCSHPAELLNHDLSKAVILDVAKGIDNVTHFDDVDSLEFSVIFSLHDFDLSYFLKLLKETGKLKKIDILGVPAGYDADKAVREIKFSFSEVFK
jgi:Ni,Fe-hydrogenase maturation factor